MDAILVIALLTPLVQCQTPQYYEPEWSGRGCRPGETVDVGRGSGSCNTDCDCPLCAPFCSKSGGYCQNHQRNGRRKCLASDKSTAACPPLIGDPSPPGCNLTFVRDVNGEFPCEDTSDCPMGYDWWADQPDGGREDTKRTYGSCGTPWLGDVEEKKCKFVSSNSGWFAPCFNEDDNMIILNRFNSTITEYECNVNEDCFCLHWTESFNSKLQMKCESNKCISRNRYLWSDISYTKYENAEYRELRNIQSKYGSSSSAIFGIYRCSDARRGYGGTVGFSRDTPSISIVSNSNSISSCDNCSKTDCPPDKPCPGRNGNCLKANCNKKKCWCPKPRRRRG